MLDWESSQRVLAYRHIIEDERAQWGDWVADNHALVERLRKRRGKASEQSASGVPRLTIDDYKRELEENRQGYANATKQLQEHRHALAVGDKANVLDLEVVEFVEHAADVHQAQIEGLSAAILELTNDAPATVGE